MIEYIEQNTIYENPCPLVHSRHGYFPGMARLPSGELICLFVLAEAIEAPNGTTYVTRSSDGGRTWQLQGPVCDKRTVGFPTTDALKPTVLRNGSLIATGYRFHRHDPEQPIGIQDTGGLLPGDDVVCVSSDGGRNWSVPRIIERSWPELLEISGPCIETTSGDLVAVGAPLKLPDGSNPSGQLGVLLRSGDQGKTWDDHTVFFRSADRNITPLEARICEMQPGRLVVIAWAYDYGRDLHRTNHAVVSHNNGRTWSAPIDTGNWGQASSVYWLAGDRLASIHAHRGPEYKIFVRLIDFAQDRWRVVEEKSIWNGPAHGRASEKASMVEMFKALRFGQPSLVRLAGDEFLAVHWSIEEGQGRIRSHRLRIQWDS